MAVTSVACRVIERIIVNHMFDFLISTGKIITGNNSSQHGFVPKRSVETACLDFLHFVLLNLDRGKDVDVILLDFSKAFEKVPHTLLITKLSGFGICDPLLSWISDFLRLRRQIVKVFFSVSSSKPVLSGVIQGSVLGPLLFVLFINDLDDCVFHSYLIKYADDVKLAIAYDRNDNSRLRHRSLLQDDLNRIELWSHSNLLPLNVRKCQFISFGRKDTSSFCFTFDGIPIDNSSCVRDLGVFISSPFNFKFHIASVVSKANRMLGVIKRVFSVSNRDVFLSLYKCYVRPILEFASIVWCPYQQYLIDEIEKVQKRFTRMFNDLRSMPYRDWLKLLNLLSLSARRLRYKLIFLFKMANGLVDLDILSFFRFATCNFTRGNAFKLSTQFARTNDFLFFFVNDVVSHWNSLNDDDICTTDVGHFKKSVGGAYFARVDIW